MNKRKKLRKPKTSGQSESEETRLFTWIPLWGWVLIFLVPLLLSEYMFYVAGRTLSVILFPIVWTGFWFAMMERSDWWILKRGRDKEE